MTIETSAYFDKQLKKLAKKYRSIPTDYANLLHELMDNPTKGIEIRNGVFKIQLAIASKKTGKSGGSRVITYYRDEFDTLYLLDIYDKSEKEDISDKDLDYFIEEINKIGK
jgi:mRNA-degrading endonuclease RelE of RelBE toxin-antitoxin system